MRLRDAVRETKVEMSVREDRGSAVRTHVHLGLSTPG